MKKSRFSEEQVIAIVKPRAEFLNAELFDILTGTQLKLNNRRNFDNQKTLVTRIRRSSHVRVVL